MTVTGLLRGCSRFEVELFYKLVEVLHFEFCLCAPGFNVIIRT